METHTPALLLFARQQTRCEADARDILQEAVVEAWAQQPSGAPPRMAFVYATVRRRAIDLARRDTRRAVREAVATGDCAVPWFDSTPEERERDRLLQDAMNSLPGIYREVVTLKIWGGLTFAEIAEALDIPANTAASRYRYGIAELRKRTREVLT